MAVVYFIKHLIRLLVKIFLFLSRERFSLHYITVSLLWKLKKVWPGWCMLVSTVQILQGMLLFTV